MKIEADNIEVFFALIALLPIVIALAYTTLDKVKGTRKKLVISARAFTVLLVVTGLAGIKLWHQETEDQLASFVLIDVSQSIPDAVLEDAYPRIQELLDKSDEDHQCGVVLFANDAQVAFSLSAEHIDKTALSNAVSSFRDQAQKHPQQETNLNKAIDVARSLFPADRGSRLLIYSDANANVAGADANIAICKGRGIDVFVSAYSFEKAAFDIALKKCTVPTKVSRGQGFEVEIEISTRSDCEATLSLFRNGLLLKEKALSLKEGASKHVFHELLEKADSYIYRAVISSDKEQENVNNDSAYAFTKLGGQINLLILGEDLLEARSLMTACEANDIEAEFRLPQGAPQSLMDLLRFDVVVLNNIRAKAIRDSSANLLVDYVRTFGRKLINIGLDSSNGYGSSPIGEALPVVTDVSRMKVPSSSVIVIADTSKSLILQNNKPMSEAAMDEKKLLNRPRLIRQAVKNVMNSLSNNDFFGCIGFGDTRYDPVWIVQPQKVYDRNNIIQSIDKLMVTKPYFINPQELEAVINELQPKKKRTADEYATDFDKMISPFSLPHINQKKLMNYLRYTIGCQKKGILPNKIAAKIDTLLQKNMFLARSNVYLSIRNCITALGQKDTADKRIIIISDGYFEGNVDYTKLSAQLSADGIDVSILTWHDAGNIDTTALQNMSKLGKGHYKVYSTDGDQKTQTLANPAVMESVFQAQKVSSSPLLKGNNITLAPALYGYVRSTPKLGAQTLLGVPPDLEPLLASWTYGLGSSLVFTSDAQDRWASSWINNWEKGYQQLWTSIISNSESAREDIQLIPELKINGRHVEISVDIIKDGLHFVNGENLTVRFYYLGTQGYLFAKEKYQDLSMRQLKPGMYAGAFTAEKKGMYIARISNEDKTLIENIGIIISTDAEAGILHVDTNRAEKWADIGGGALNPSVEMLMDIENKSHQAAYNMSAIALIIAALCFVIDVILRRWPAFHLLLSKKAKNEST
ncbi:MAG: VWA domain-containing protein [Planctomycetes bacterium]|nr:VWA domain-containing protein [Planctomycetota bacterium]